MKISKQIVKSLILIFGIVSSFGVADAKDNIQIGVYILAPWVYEVDGKLQGAEIELLGETTKRLGVTASYNVLPFKRLLSDMKEGRLDMMLGIFKKPEREVFIHYIEPPYQLKSNKAFYVLKGNEQLVTKYEDLHQLTVGAILAAKYFPSFDDDSNIKKEYVYENKQNFPKLLDNRIDTFIATESSADYLIHEMGFQDQIVKAPFSFSQSNKSYFGISKKSHLMKDIKRVEHVIRTMIEDGGVDRVYKDFFEKVNLPLPAHR